jgi:DNA-binding Lrp family transcriptional regulator
MMRELLNLLSEGKTRTQYEMAEQFGATPERIAASIDFLHRAGYLRKVCAAGDCGKKCAGCVGGSAMPENYPAVWEVVKEGI